MIYNKETKISHNCIVSFARKVYGKKSYLASCFFYKWAFSQNYINIYTSESKADEITSMIQSISTTVNQIQIESFFNYITDEEHKGDGLRHLLKIKNSAAFFVPAVYSQKLSLMYEKFGGNKLPFYWYKRYIIPLPSMTTINYYFKNKKVLIHDENSGIQISNIITDQLINKICKISGLEKKYLKWRLSSVKNSRVFILQNTEDKSIIVTAIGKRRGVPVLRVISSFGPSVSVKKLIDKACKLGSSLGVFVCLVTIPESQSRHLKNDKKYLKRSGIATFIKGNVSAEGFLMLCGDLGLEEQLGG